MKLSKENYYSQEANREYMSHSQYESFLKCPAATMAELNGERVEPANDNLLVGSFLHSWSDHTIEQFKEEHEEMFSTRGATKGQLKANFQFVNEMIATLENDPFCMFVLEGQKEVIMTAEMFGVPWKIRMDVYNPDKRRIIDLKTTRSINDLVWSEERWAKVSFLEAYHYASQMAIYAEIERLASGGTQWAEPLIVAVSKENPPDKAIISLNDSKMIQRELDLIEGNMPWILDIKSGKKEPTRCERCEYCRSTKKLNKVMFYTDIGQA